MGRMRLEAEGLLAQARKDLTPAQVSLQEPLAQAPLPITLALLFGSRARGEALLESDWDLLVVSPASGHGLPGKASPPPRPSPPPRGVRGPHPRGRGSPARGDRGVGEAAREGVVLLGNPLPGHPSSGGKPLG